MGGKKENGGKSTMDDKKVPIATVVKDTEGTEYQLRPLIPNTDVDFYKIYLSKFSRTLDGVMNQKMKLVLWLIRKMTLKNELKYSYREIARLSGISYQTVAETIKSLIEDDFIRRNGKTLMVNPNAVFRGRLDKKAEAWNFYSKLKQTPKKQKKRQEEESEKELDKIEQAEAPEEEQEPGKEQKQGKKLKKEPLSLKDKNDLEWELMELSKEISRLNNWRDNIETQLYYDEKKRCKRGTGKNRGGYRKALGQGKVPQRAALFSRTARRR